MLESARFNGAARVDPEQWSQIDKLFKEALEREPRDRTEFLDRACREDPSLRKELESLIRAHDRADSFLSLSSKSTGSLIGKVVGHYEVTSLLGSGGMGEVYVAYDPRLDRRVAIKLLREHLAADTVARERLRREALAAAALDHPFICKIF